MNEWSVHIALNHFPMFALAAGLLLLTAGLLGRRVEWVRLSLAVFVATTIAATGSYATGVSAARQLSGIPGMGFVVERHGNAAFYALLLSAILGAFSLAALVLYRKKLPRPLGLALWLLAGVVMVVMGWTTRLGIDIHHGPQMADTMVRSPVERAFGHAPSDPPHFDHDSRTLECGEQ